MRSQCHVRQVLVQHKPNLVFLFETHVAFENNSRFYDKQVYKDIAVEEGQGHAGGAWVLKWMGGAYRFHVMESMS